MKINIVTKAEFAYEKHVMQPNIQQALKLLGVFDNTQLALAHRSLWCLAWVRAQKILAKR